MNELARPSSVEVKEIIQQLVQNTLQRFFKNDMISEHTVGPLAQDAESCEDGYDESHEKIGTSRDYLAKLLFWFVYFSISYCGYCFHETIQFNSSCSGSSFQILLWIYVLPTSFVNNGEIRQILLVSLHHRWYLPHRLEELQSGSALREKTLIQFFQRNLGMKVELKLQVFCFSPR